MTAFTITSDDTLTLFDRVFGDFATGDVSTVTFPNAKVDVKTGKNKNTIYSRNAAGENAELVLRLLRGSSDDVFMAQKLLQQDNDFVGVSLAKGEFVKRLGDGQGNVLRDVYSLSGGVFSKNVAGKENVEGDIEQGVAIYTLMFSSAQRSPQ